MKDTMANKSKIAKSEWEEARDELKKFRDDHARQSTQVIRLWTSVLCNKKNKLGDDLWPICEQVVVAACDCSNKPIAEVCLNILQTKFPESLRVHTLQGMVQESFYSIGDAKKTYDAIQEQDESNTVSVKRQIAILKSENKLKEATEQLRSHLENWQGDLESWQELAQLYSEQGEYSKACFCMEELVLVHPENSQAHAQLGMLLYTSGSHNDLKLARKHFAQALKLQGNCVRSLLAFNLICHKLSLIEKTNKKENIEFGGWATKQIQEIYQNASEENCDIMISAIDRLRGALVVS